MLINIKDKIFLGMVSTLLGVFPLGLIDYALYLLGINKYHIVHIAASAYFPVSQVKTLPAVIVGTISHLNLFFILGVIIVYLLYYTGTDYFWAKGASVFLTAWLLVFGVVLRLKIGRIDPVDSGTNLTQLTLHLIAGPFIAWLAIKLGNDTLVKE